jgi:hypothetical protein
MENNPRPGGGRTRQRSKRTRGGGGSRWWWWGIQTSTCDASKETPGSRRPDARPVCFFLSQVPIDPYLLLCMFVWIGTTGYAFYLAMSSWALSLVPSSLRGSRTSSSRLGKLEWGGSDTFKFRAWVLDAFAGVAYKLRSTPSYHVCVRVENFTPQSLAGA